MAKAPYKKYLRRGLWTILALFLVVNVIAAFHAYKFTHFQTGGVKTERLHLTPLKKLQLLFTGIDNPRPVDLFLPSHAYKTVVVQSNVKIECWLIPATGGRHRGSVVLFHGYTSSKSALLARAEPFLQNGYDCLLADFMGSGGSEGNTTTIGFKEAAEVKDCFEYLKSTGEQHICLYGSSMGAAAIMKALKDYPISPAAIIIECPFATMYQTVCARFRMLHIPSFPMAGILLFWGSVENGFWGFAHNPVDDARYIRCPTLLQYGEKDDRVTREEIDAIYSRLSCPKKLILYPQAGHDNYLDVCKEEWSGNMISFLDKN